MNHTATPSPITLHIDDEALSAAHAAAAAAAAAEHRAIEERFSATYDADTGTMAGPWDDSTIIPAARAACGPLVKKVFEAAAVAHRIPQESAHCWGPAGRMALAIARAHAKPYLD